MVATTQPLEREQQLLLQRVLASHCMSHKEAERVFNELQVPNASLEEAFETINRQLTKGFGLEIATVVLDRTKYHSVINLRNDEVSGDAFEMHYNAHERALVRLILEKFAQTDDDDDEEGGGTVMTLPKKDLVNLRNDLKEPYRLTVAQAEHVVEMLLDEKFIRISTGVTTSSQRRESLQTQLELAPRAYLELSTYLSDLGIPEKSMPQFLRHRS